MKDVLLRLVTGAMKIKRIQESYVDVGLDDSKIFDAWSDIADAISHLIGEDVDEFENSVTHLALTAPILTNERRTELLWSVCKKSHAKAPSFLNPDDMEKMVYANGGYSVTSGYVRPKAVAETPEGEWE